MHWKDLSTVIKSVIKSISLTFNLFTFNDMFDSIRQICEVLTDLLDQGYQWVSFDFESSFTNEPHDKVVQIVLSRVYDDKLVTPNWEREHLRNLLRIVARKGHFLSTQFFMNKLMSSLWYFNSFSPVLANIIMTEVENVVHKMLNNGLIIIMDANLLTACWFWLNLRIVIMQKLILMSIN